MRRGPPSRTISWTATVPVGSATLTADVSVPAGPLGVVAFAHGSGSSRLSWRNRTVAEILNEGGLATVLLDLLTVQEETADRATSHLRFDIRLLADRLVDAADWLRLADHTRGLPVGCFGSSTGAAAALVAAARRPEIVAAVVSRGGRPDLAGPALSRVRAPTLLIVGGLDTTVIELNQEAFALLPYEKRLAIVPGATHLFEEPGALEQVAELARDWFTRSLRFVSPPPEPEPRRPRGGPSNP